MIILQWNSNGNGVQKTLKRNGRNEVGGTMTMIHDTGAADANFIRNFLKFLSFNCANKIFQHNLKKTGKQSKVYLSFLIRANVKCSSFLCLKFQAAILGAIASTIVLTVLLLLGPPFSTCPVGSTSRYLLFSAYLYYK